MNRFFSILRYAMVASAIVFISSCSDDEKTSETRTEPAYVILNAAVKWDEGYINTFDNFPSGTIAPVSNKSFQVDDSFGFRSFGNYIITRSSTAGDAGLQKYTVNKDGSLKDEGFIQNGSQFIIVNENTGFYLDEVRGSMKVQIFDPSTMTRTGEVDLSELRDEEISDYQVVGKHILAAKEGKLYASMTYYNNAASQGYGDDQIGHVEFAVIDIATKTFDKVITYNDEAINSVGWGSSGNKMWTLGDDGALYIYSTGLTNGFSVSKVIRINEGETEFDTDWTLVASEIGPGTKSSIVTGLVKDGKIYLELASEDLKSDYANLQNIIFDYYAVDIATGESTLITGMPQHHYAWANEQCITEIDGQILFWVRNPAQDIDAYYALNANGTSATQKFNMDHDGFIWGFVKLDY